MIARIQGELIFKSPEKIIVDVGGVGFELFIPLSTYFELPKTGEAVHLKVHTHLREDNISLYGFLTEEEKALFQMLIAVSKIGPKIALNFLSKINQKELLRAIASSDVLLLSSIPGIGKKTAERVIYELRDKIYSLEPQESEGDKIAGLEDGKLKDG